MATTEYTRSEAFDEELRKNKRIPQSTLNCLIVAQVFDDETMADKDKPSTTHKCQDFNLYYVEPKEEYFAEQLLGPQQRLLERTLAKLNKAQLDQEKVVFCERSGLVGCFAPACISGEGETLTGWGPPRWLVEVMPPMACLGGLCWVQCVVRPRIEAARAARRKYLESIIEGLGWEDAGFQWLLRGGTYLAISEGKKKMQKKNAAHVYREWWEVRQKPGSTPFKIGGESPSKTPNSDLKSEPTTPQGEELRAVGNGWSAGGSAMAQAKGRNIQTLPPLAPAQALGGEGGVVLSQSEYDKLRSSTQSQSDKLVELKKMFDAHLISEFEYNNKRERIMSSL